MGTIKWSCVNYVKDENPWITFAKRQVYKKNNCINSIWTGAPGSGKSWGMLSWFSLIDPDFTLDNNWFFKASQLMRAIKRGDYPKGKMWGYDEAGIDCHNLRYADELNKGINAFLQTSRHRNYIFAFSVPYMSLVSKGVRVLMNANFRADGYNNKDQTIIFPRVLEYNGELDKFYKKRLLVKTKTGFDYCSRILLPKPPKKLVIEYEKIKKEFTGDLFENIADKMEQFELKQQQQISGGLFTKRKEEILMMLKDQKNVPYICENLGITEQTIYEHIKSIQTKGVTIQAVKDQDGRVKYYDVRDPRPESVLKRGGYL